MNVHQHAKTYGRRRSATVSGDGQADGRAHPEANIHLTNGHGEGESIGTYNGGAVEAVGPVRQAGRRRSTISGESPSDKIPRRLPGMTHPTTLVNGGRGVEEDGTSLPDRESFMESAEWLWGVLERTDRLVLG